MPGWGARNSSLVPIWHQKRWSLGGAGNFTHWAIPRHTNHTKWKAGKWEGVRGFGQHSFFPILSEVDFDESVEEFPLSTVPTFQTKLLIKLVNPTPIREGFPAPSAGWDVDCNHESRALCAAGTEKPAHWASRGVTDFLRRWCYPSVACVTICFHNASWEEFLGSARPAASQLGGEDMQSPVEPHWQPEWQPNTPLGRREEEPETLSQGHCSSTFPEQEKTGAPEWDTTSWVSTNLLILTQPKTLINTFFFWLQNPFPPTQVWHRSLRSSDLTSNSLDDK